eukprot:m.55899 g.55899  ORF g.55899 m.55899 type:complete len:267 (+) comp22152_c0_seq1:68-868(+)
MAARTIVVFGASGFIGGRICAEAARKGFNVVGLSRSANPLPYFATQASGDGSITLAKADATDPKSYTQHLTSASAVIIAIGAAPIPNRFVGGMEAALRSNGQTVIKPLAAAKEAKVPKVVVVNATMPRWLEHISSGYYVGKEMARSAAKQAANAKTNVVCLKPSLVFGTRHIGEAQVPLPLQLVFGPTRMFLNLTPVANATTWLKTTFPYLFHGILEEFVSVEELARTAVAYATETTSSDYIEVLPSEIVKKSHAEGLEKFLENNR